MNEWAGIQLMEHSQKASEAINRKCKVQECTRQR